MRTLKRVLLSVGLVATAVLCCGASRPANVPPPSCYGPACIAGGSCNFITRVGTCISTCPCILVRQGPGLSGESQQSCPVR
jgi:hypothetical protein